MSKILVIVESPGKIKKIQKILGNEYIVKASFGHCRDLDSKQLSIDVNNNFNPNYIIISSKKKIVKELREAHKECNEVILAMDEDREGEMIASSLRDILKLKNPKRIVFHEITQNAIDNSIKNPTVINEDMVYAQQTRRLLDRLVGYKLSPLLWKELKGELSAGRVQSVVVKIIIDKENEINDSISTPYFKTTAVFNFNSDLNSVLMIKNNIYKFDSEDQIESFLKVLKKTNTNKVTEISNKETAKKPPLPFITSSLQQDASTKYGYSSKFTMSIAQKLYEAGYITYMRTDSTILSKECLKQCKDYIVKTYGEKYSLSRNISKKVKGGQEAHEAIRPTDIERTVDKIKLGDECKRLYKLIWNRTVASQMSNGKINIQTIFIDVLENKKSILPNGTLFVSTFEKILFDGFLVLYNNHESENKKGTFDISKNTDVEFKSLKITEEYTKPPLRFNEAGLIKHLEKNGIGRPSTYASIMTKIIDKNYVSIQNIEGKEKDSKIFSINQKYKLKETTKKIKIGSENKKIVPTQIGIKVNNFLVENFMSIMDVDFTVNLEKELDKVANGKATWYNILGLYYDKFKPMVEELNEKNRNITDLNKTDEVFSKHPTLGCDIYMGEGKYGPYLKYMEDDKWKFTSIKDFNRDELTDEKIKELFEYPKYIGKINNSNVTLNKGQYGLYFKIGNKKCSIKNEDRELNIEYAKELYNTDDPYALKTFKFDKKTVYLKKGPYGYFLKVVFKSKKIKNISLPNNIDVDTFNISNFISS
jgi:DNA topoisomerase I